MSARSSYSYIYPSTTKLHAVLVASTSYTCLQLSQCCSSKGPPPCQAMQTCCQLWQNCWTAQSCPFVAISCARFALSLSLSLWPPLPALSLALSLSACLSPCLTHTHALTSLPLLCLLPLLHPPLSLCHSIMHLRSQARGVQMRARLYCLAPPPQQLLHWGVRVPPAPAAPAAGGPW